MNRNKAMKKKGLKGSFPSGSGGSLSTGLSSRASLGDGIKETARQGKNQMPAKATTVPFKGK